MNRSPQQVLFQLPHCHGCHSIVAAHLWTPPFQSHCPLYADKAPVHGYRILNIITPDCSDHQLDAWLTSAHIEVALEVVREQVPCLRGVRFQTDNCST